MSELITFSPVQTRQNASVKYMSTKSAFMTSAFLKVKSEASRAPKQEPAISPSVLPSLTVPCCHLELNLGCGYGNALLKPCPCGEWLKWLAAQCFSGQPLFVLQVSKGNQRACFAHRQCRHYPPQVFHAHPLGNPGWQEAQP